MACSPGDALLIGEFDLREHLIFFRMISLDHCSCMGGQDFDSDVDFELVVTVIPPFRVSLMRVSART